MKFLLVICAVGFLAGCTPSTKTINPETSQTNTATEALNETPDATNNKPSSEKIQVATFAGGCFWCVEAPFEKMDGVISAVSGYAGGISKTTSYRKVASGETKHIESVQVTYDSSKVSYNDLLKVFWKNIDPTDKGGQFVDRGHQYSTAVFFHNEQQKADTEKSIQYINSKKYFTKPVVTDVRPYTFFIDAEDYHQDYYKKNIVTAAKYKLYRSGSGRDQFINKYWKGKALEF